LKVGEIQLSCPQVFASPLKVSQKLTEGVASQFGQRLMKMRRKIRCEEEKEKEMKNRAYHEHFDGAAPAVDRLKVTLVVNRDNQDKPGNP
jgi:hypothetical protein